MPKQVSIDYNPTEKQRLFHESSVDELLYGGAAGGGKSHAIVMDAFLRCIFYPGTAAYIFRRTFPELKDSIIKIARQWIPEGIGRYVESSHEMRLPKGSVIRFCHCANEADVYNYLGAEIQWLYIDELTTFTLSMYNYLKTRLRAAKRLGVTPLVRCASNPGNIGHGWVKEWFVDAAPYGQIVEEKIESSLSGKTKISKRQYIPALVKDNPHIDDVYEFQLAQKPEKLRRALLHGDWDAFEGQVFMEFADRPEHYRDRQYTHVIEPFAIPDSWARYVSMDWGSNKPFSVGWFAVAPDETAYHYREWYGWDGTPNNGCRKTNMEIARGILEREAAERERGIEFIRVADPACWQEYGGPSIAQQMGAAGVWFRRGDHARIAGKMMLHEKLRFDGQGKPGLYVFANCEHFIRTVPNLPYDPIKVEDVDTDAEDHVFDMCKYFLMSRYGPNKIEVQPRRTGYDPFTRYGDKG